ncbi:MAG TPA: hypothetical protein VIJ65_09625 [Acidobacteriaceae bacterium]
MNSIHRIVLTCMMLFAFAAAAEDCGPLPNLPARTPIVEITIVKSPLAPVLSIQSPDARGVLGGFEGGTVVKTGDRYHAFMTEMMRGWDTGSAFIKTRLADWVSSDGMHWRRVGTVFSSTGDNTGADPRAALWAPMPVYNSAERRWNLFYVAYRSKPNVPPAWYLNYDGELVRAVSQVKGREGIDGPYRDAGIVMRTGPGSDKWEGLQGDDSVSPYPAEGRWFTFYGSSDTGKALHSWEVGLASAPELSGPWKRCSSLNPVPLGHFVENPIVTKIGDTYVAIYDDLNPEQGQSMGYTASLDGVHWTAGKDLPLFPRAVAQPRTPLSLLPNADGTFDLFVTALSTVTPANGGKTATAEALYLLKVRVSISQSGKH